MPHVFPIIHRYVRSVQHERAYPATLSETVTKARDVFIEPPCYYFDGVIVVQTAGIPWSRLLEVGQLHGPANMRTNLAEVVIESFESANEIYEDFPILIADPLDLRHEHFRLVVIGKCLLSVSKPHPFI